MPVAVSRAVAAPSRPSFSAPVNIPPWQVDLRRAMTPLLPDPGRQRLRSLLEYQMEHDTPGLLAWLRALSAEDRATLPIQWERMQPVSLHDVETIMALAPPDAVELLRDRFAALIDGDATTRAWVKSLPPGEARDAAWEDYAARAGQLRPDSLPDLLKEAPNDKARRRLTSILAGLRATIDPQGGMAFADGLPDPLARRAARLTVMHAIGKTDSVQAFRMFAATEESWSEAGLARLIPLFSGTAEPEILATEGLRLKNPKTRDAVVDSALSTWLWQDVHGASDWIRQLPVGDLQDRQVVALAQYLSSISPAEAIGWALTIRGEETRSEAVLEVAIDWVRRSPAEFTAWMAQTPLDPAIRADIEGVFRSTKFHWGAWSDEDGTFIVSPR